MSNLLPANPESLADAVRAWLCGAPKEDIAKLIKVEPITLRHWLKHPQWQELARRLAPEVQATVSGALTRLKTKALEQLEQRITNGDPIINNLGEVVYKEDGTVATRPLKGRDLADIFTKVSDSQFQLEKMLGNIKDDDDKDRLSLEQLAAGLSELGKLAEQRRFSKATEITGETVTQSSHSVQ